MSQTKKITYNDDEEVVFFVLPKEKAELATLAVCSNFSYQPEVFDADNPGKKTPNTEKPEKFTKRMVVEWVEMQTRNYLERKAKEENQINVALNVKI